ncbi:hypothetical protein B0E43_10485 [Algoriphagus sp. A40]|nr:hypothetical protein B0E43_10485 [Algoriphagus sp. A40]
MEIVGFISKRALVDTTVYVMEWAWAASTTSHVCVVFCTMAVQLTQGFALVFSSAPLVEKVIPQRISMSFQKVFIRI